MIELKEAKILETHSESTASCTLWKCAFLSFVFADTKIVPDGQPRRGDIGAGFCTWQARNCGDRESAVGRVDRRTR